MPLRRAALALPTDRLADLGLDYQGTDAANLLALWTVLWHPALTATTGAIPTIRAVGSLVEQTDLDGELVLVPDITWADDITAWRQTLDANQVGQVPDLRDKVARSEAWDNIRAGLVEHLSGNEIPAADVAEFYALGYAYFQVEMLTRVMRYQPISAESNFTSAVIAASQKAVAGEPFDEDLATAYDQLTQSRNHYYPVDFHLIDLTLTADSLAIETLNSAADAKHSRNLLVTGEYAERISAQHTDIASSIRDAVEGGTLELVGGSFAGGQLSRLDPESLLDDIRRGRKAISELGAAPQAFAHFEGAVAPLIPQLVKHLGYGGVLATNFDGRPMPPLYPPRCQWQGLDGTRVEALAAPPLDRGDAGTMLRLAEHLSHAMDNDLVATLVLAGWPGANSPHFDDLLRIAARSEVLGRFVTLGEFFKTTSSADRIESLSAAKYRGSDELISTGEQTTQAARTGLYALARGSATHHDAVDWPSLLGVNSESQDGAGGWLLVNASSHPCSHFVARHSEDQVSATPVAPWGFAWEPAQLPPPPVPLATEETLANEAIELDFDAMTGGIQSLRLHASRGTQLSQKLAIAGAVATGVQIAFDGLSLAGNDSRQASYLSRHRMVNPDGDTLLKIEQRVSLVRRSAEVRFGWRIERLAETIPSQCALTSHIAWRDFAAELFRECQGIALPHSTRRVDPTSWLHIASSVTPITLLANRSLAHDRIEKNQLHTTLPMPAAGESLEVELAYQFSQPYPVRRVGEKQLAIPVSGQPVQTQGWWLHVSKPAVTVTHVGFAEDREQPTIELRLLETSGTPCQCRVDLWCPIASARRVDFHGGGEESLTVQQGGAIVPFSSHEWTQIELALDLDGGCP